MAEECRNSFLIQGCGWVRKDTCGVANKNRCWSYEPTTKSLFAILQEEAILAYPVGNGGRLDAASRIVMAAVALALFDADIRYNKGEKKDIGLLGTSPDGARYANLDYFRDYVTCGRKLGRGNLFIYTLPSSPLAESAIYFGLAGPLIYERYADSSQRAMLNQAEEMVRQKEAVAMVAVDFNATEARCYYVAGETA